MLPLGLPGPPPEGLSTVFEKETCLEVALTPPRASTAPEWSLLEGGSQPFAPRSFPHVTHSLVGGCLGMWNLSGRQLPFAKGDSPETGAAESH